ncbi:hypothetical protein [Rhizobium sp. NFR07]|nr:hypothetical protein [Rhizobium sp. NFR07]
MATAVDLAHEVAARILEAGIIGASGRIPQTEIELPFSADADARRMNDD